MKHLIISISAFLILLFLPFGTFAQNINGYAKVNAIAGNTLTLDGTHINIASHNFIVGQKVIIMQMQDTVIGTNTTNASSFGTLAHIANAGRYEISTITAVNGNSTLGHSDASPSTIQLDVISLSYNTSSDASLQIITFRNFNPGGNYTTTSNISPIPWNGNIGGVLAIEVSGTLTIEHNISANGIGFRGGARSNDHGGTQCAAANVALYAGNDNQTGFKGEGIQKFTSNTFNNRRAPFINGGGGGVHHNSGGGGGGNYTSGGNGGEGYNGGAGGCTAHPAPGIGGYNLSTYITANRVFLGGGAGGGQQNNSVGTAGANGGGIILIKANTITTTGTGSATISANGASPSSNASNDGAGGGGGGGSIVFAVNNWSVSASFPLTITANGGNGSSSNTGVFHGAGGAGGQGTIQYSSAEPTTNVTTQTNNGTPGCNNNSSPCNALAGAATGSNGAGVFDEVFTILPVELLSFNANLIDQKTALISWITSMEINNSHFTLYKSIDGINWEELIQIEGQGNSNNQMAYETFDFNLNPGINYYQLKQTDHDGSSKIIGIQYLINESSIMGLAVYPNPSNGIITIEAEYDLQYAEISIFDVMGNVISKQIIESKITKIDLPQTSGVYFVKIQLGNRIINHKILRN